VFLVAVLLGIGVGLLGLSDLVGAIVFAAGVSVAVLAFLFYIITVFGAPAWVGMALGSLALSLDSIPRRLAALIIGLVVVVALSSIPVAGRWIGLIVALFGLGAAILAFRPRRTTPMTLEPSGVTPEAR
jgi:hypothetical protein